MMIQTFGERLLPIAAVTARIGMKKTWLYAQIRKGKFPRPLKLGRAARWRLSDVSRWLAEQASPGGLQ